MSHLVFSMMERLVRIVSPLYVPFILSIDYQISHLVFCMLETMMRNVSVKIMIMTMMSTIRCHILFFSILEMIMMIVPTTICHFATYQMKFIAEGNGDSEIFIWFPIYRVGTVN